MGRTTAHVSIDQRILAEVDRELAAEQMSRSELTERLYAAWLERRKEGGTEREVTVLRRSAQMLG